MWTRSVTTTQIPSPPAVQFLKDTLSVHEIRKTDPDRPGNLTAWALRIPEYWPSGWSRLGESNPGPTHYEYPGHQPTSAHPSYLRTPATPPRHSVHTWRYKRLSFRPRVRPRRRSSTRSWTPSRSRSEPKHGLELRTARLQEALIVCLACPTPERRALPGVAVVVIGAHLQQFGDTAVDALSTVDSTDLPLRGSQLMIKAPSGRPPTRSVDSAVDLRRHVRISRSTSVTISSMTSSAWSSRDSEMSSGGLTLIRLPSPA